MSVKHAFLRTTGTRTSKIVCPKPSASPRPRILRFEMLVTFRKGPDARARRPSALNMFSILGATSLPMSTQTTNSDRFLEYQTSYGAIPLLCLELSAMAADGPTYAPNWRCREDMLYTGHPRCLVCKMVTADTIDRECSSCRRGI